MGVYVARIVAFLGDGMVDRDIGDHTPRNELLGHEAAQQPNPLSVRKLMWQRQIDFAGKLGVDPLLHRLDGIPEPLSVRQPRRTTLRKQDFGMGHAPPTAIVRHPTILPVAEPNAGPIGRRRNRRTPFGSSDDLHREMIRRDGTVFPSSRPGWSHLCCAAMYKCAIPNQRRRLNWSFSLASSEV